MKQHIRWSIYLMLVIVANGCNSTKSVRSSLLPSAETSPIKKGIDFYKVYKIDSINNWYLIYAKRKDALYKIISKKVAPNVSPNIKLNENYKFLVGSIWHKPIMISYINVSPSATPYVTCLGFDDSTNICLERDSMNDYFMLQMSRGYILSENNIIRLPGEFNKTIL